VVDCGNDVGLGGCQRPSIFVELSVKCKKLITRLISWQIHELPLCTECCGGISLITLGESKQECILGFVTFGIEWRGGQFVYMVGFKS